MSPDRQRAFQLAVRFLSRADRTANEVRLHLELKGVDPDLADEISSRLTKEGFVDDSRVAERETELAKGPRRIGRGLLSARLERRGVGEDVIDQTSREYSEKEECENALAALRAKFKEGADMGKAARFLAGRGFSEEAVRSALEAFFPDWDG
ncbi:MAG: RecX family transcriptional regulator [Fimbriimonadaceae bacterium]|nr:RecX family transcriptional regulator [Fimbriimonadaceae bacterium]QYK56332.1 MAG: RecX family transcriptional regulator [Fimbriimonadaceae bacterium]